MATKIEEMKELVKTAAQDLEKFEAGNKSAGTRVRKAMQDIKALCQGIRLDVQSKKNEAK